MATLDDLRTPALVLDRGRLDNNLARMRARARSLGVRLRPHLKTAKSAEVARLARDGADGGITVSTLAEAAYFARAGFTDILYGVGITADKCADVAAIAAETGATITVVVDSADAARAVAAHTGAPLDTLIEVDCGQHRAGCAADSEAFMAIAQTLQAGPGSRLAGVTTHAGHSYACRTVPEIEAVAEAERATVVAAAERLRAAGLPCPVASVGSTPTALHARHLDGVSEMRPGVYMFGDLFQTAIASCGPDDLALSVLASVVGVYPDRGLALIDAGALALSQDRSMDAITGEPSYGAVYDAAGTTRLNGVRIGAVNQEHGFLSGDIGGLSVGQRVRVFPNHACMTAAAYDHYNVIDGSSAIVDTWDRVNGW